MRQIVCGLQAGFGALRDSTPLSGLQADVMALDTFDGLNKATIQVSLPLKVSPVFKSRNLV